MDYCIHIPIMSQELRRTRRSRKPVQLWTVVFWLETVRWRSRTIVSSGKQFKTDFKINSAAYEVYVSGVRELSRRGEKAFSAFLILLTVFAKTVPPILIAGLAAAAGAWVVNHVQM